MCHARDNYGLMPECAFYNQMGQVCGSNGITYKNLCAVTAHMELYPHLYVNHYGQCNRPCKSCTSDSECISSDLCIPPLLPEKPCGNRPCKKLPKCNPLCHAKPCIKICEKTLCKPNYHWNVKLGKCLKDTVIYSSNKITPYSLSIAELPDVTEISEITKVSKVTEISDVTEIPHQKLTKKSLRNGSREDFIESSKEYQYDYSNNIEDGNPNYQLSLSLY